MAGMSAEHAVVVGEVPGSSQAEVIACLEVYSIQSDNSPQLARWRMDLVVPKNSGSKPLKDGASCDTFRAEMMTHPQTTSLEEV